MGGGESFYWVPAHKADLPLFHYWLPLRPRPAGHLSPPALMQRIRAAGWLPHRVNVLGRLERIPAAEVGAGCAGQGRCGQ